MKFLLYLTVVVSLSAKESFITPEEYAAQLYHNPRGIGCHLCHGENGEGKLIARYEHKNEKKAFAGPAINVLDFKAFYKALDSRVRGMPRYFLTEQEVRALYYYLHPKKRGLNDGTK